LFERHKIQALHDDELVKSFCSSNENIFLEELFGRYIRFVFLISLKYLKNEDSAKDAAMQVFEKVSHDLKRFEVHNFKSWLHVTTKNFCLMQLRSGNKTQTIDIDNEKYFEQNMENNPYLHHDYDSEKELKLEQLEKAVSALDNEQKQCVELFYLQEKSYKEVADITGFTMNQVKSHIQNGKRNLKNLLLENGDLMLYVFVLLYLI
jgi:RNA polymerase sigma factor (sigma-70 family)